MSTSQRRRSAGAVVAVLSVGLIFWATLIHDPLPPSPVPALSLRAFKSEVGVPIRKSSEDYDFSMIQRHIREHRIELAGCLMRNPNFKAHKIHMALYWEAQGLLQRIDLKPSPGDEVVQCITELARKWPAKAHPALQPFFFKMTLIPGGL